MLAGSVYYNYLYNSTTVVFVLLIMFACVVCYQKSENIYSEILKLFSEVFAIFIFAMRLKESQIIDKKKLSLIAIYNYNCLHTILLLIMITFNASIIYCDYANHIDDK